jgi:hypothetical protein
MNHRSSLSSALSLALLAAAAWLAVRQDAARAQNAPAPVAPAAAAPPLVFAKPDRIRYDDKSLLIDGKPVFIYSGAFHYFRCPRELWKDRFTRMKEAGLNCVETYLAWNYHEPNEPAGPADFSKLQHMDDLNDWIQMARDMGFHVIIRPGPYICAEWDRGGLPEWLINHKPADFRTTGGGFVRSSHPDMLKWDKHWLEAAAKVVKPHLVTNLPPGTPGVILWQVENEFNLCDITPDEQGVVLQALVEYSIAAGIDVPQFGCRTKTANHTPFLQAHLFDTVTCYPKYDMNLLVDRIRNIAEPQPHKFRAVMELQAGWFSEVGGKLSEEMGFSAAQLNQLGVICLEEGFSLINWYMFYGGSQFGYGASQNMTQSYDYDAPIREHGGVGPRYLAAKSLGLMLQEHGTKLARSSAVPVKVSGIPADVHVALRKAEDGSQYFFVRTGARDAGRKGTATVNVDGREVAIAYDLPAFGAKLLHVRPGASAAQGEWLPKPAELPARAANVADVKIPAMPAAWAADEMLNWRPVKSGQTFASMGINDSRFVAFRTTFTLTEEQAKNPPALFARSDIATLLFAVNGKPLPPESTQAGFVTLAGNVKAGDNRVEILLENSGNDNHDTIDTYKRAPEVMLVPPGGTLALSDWRMKAFGAVVAFANVDFTVVPEPNILDYPRVSVTNGPNIFNEATTGLFHATLDATPAQIAAGVILALGKIDETGTLFVNGQRVGGNTTEHLLPYSADISRFLKPGKNNLAVLVANRDHAGGLYGGTHAFTRGKTIDNLELSTESRGISEKIWQIPAGQSPGKWNRFANAATPPASGSLLNWYRLEFPTPSATPGTWVPYYLHLEANINGQIFFNGHHLGAYWAGGPQRDIWLPECWLSKDGSNIITLQARATGSTEPLFKAAEVRAYKEFAEKR